MKIGAFVGVKDEVELIAPTIDHLRAIGVDLIIVFDANSTDGTRELLAQYFSERDFWIINFNDRDPNIDAWYGMASEAAQKAAAVGIDWLLYMDADELWIPASGNLRDCTALPDADVLIVDRFNVPLAAHGPTVPRSLTPESYDQLLLIVEPTPDFREYLQDNPTAPWIRAVPMPKVMVRPEQVGSLTMGFHDVIARDGDILRRIKPCDILIAHIPFSTSARFARKIDNIRKFITVHDQYLGNDLAWHWRRWVSLADQGEIDREFQSSIFNSQTIAALRNQGVIRSANEVFKERSIVGSRQC